MIPDFAIYAHRLSTSGGVGCARSLQSQSLAMLLELRALAAYPEVEIQWVYMRLKSQIKADADA